MLLVCFGWWRLLPSFLFPAVGPLSSYSTHNLQAATRLLRFVGTQGTRHAPQAKGTSQIMRAHTPLSYDDTLLLSPMVQPTNQTAHPVPRAPPREEKERAGGRRPRARRQEPPTPRQPPTPTLQSRVQTDGQKGGSLSWWAPWPPRPPRRTRSRRRRASWWRARRRSSRAPPVWFGMWVG